MTCSPSYIHRAIAEGQTPHQAFIAAKAAILEVTEFRGNFDAHGRCVFEPKFALIDPESEIVNQEKGRVIMLREPTLYDAEGRGDAVYVLGPLAVGIPFFLERSPAGDVIVL